MILVDTGPLVALFLSHPRTGQRRLRSLEGIRAEGRARAFELMESYADHPMDLADASPIVAAEALGKRKIFTVDRKDFATYRVRRGHRPFEIEIVS